MSDDLLGSMVLLHMPQWQFGLTGSVGIVIETYVTSLGVDVAVVRFSSQKTIVTTDWLTRPENCTLFNIT